MRIPLAFVAPDVIGGPKGDSRKSSAESSGTEKVRLDRALGNLG